MKALPLDQQALKRNRGRRQERRSPHASMVNWSRTPTADSVHALKSTFEDERKTHDPICSRLVKHKCPQRWQRHVFGALIVIGELKNQHRPRQPLDSNIESSSVEVIEQVATRRALVPRSTLVWSGMIQRQRLTLSCSTDGTLNVEGR